ncbi:hypothetical protein FNV43_RR26589 [Rhamnella rubrinervis]|uniref:Uncharacterized protein n=1 Tax=Rhamnella rubrinervis TaxID=2594499 RepID=A0A8K0DPK8_9ROSA|nr:hypothetical protein FNV43_RR26589 [Rhamnella rubrinervis]
MEAEKRKRTDDAEVDGKRRKAETTTVTDVEVEEFFAILKRIQMAAKHLKKSNGWDRMLTAEKWRPSFELADFVEDNGVKVESVEGNSGLDLNSKPDS